MIETTAGLSVFRSDDFPEIRVIRRDGEPWFVAKDVATALGYERTADTIRKHCKGVAEMETPSSGGNQISKVIPESDVFRLIMRSKLPTAEKFQDWVVEEVLPQIRKTGSYAVESPRMSSETSTVISKLEELIVTLKERAAVDNRTDQLADRERQLVADLPFLKGKFPVTPTKHRPNRMTDPVEFLWSVLQNKSKWTVVQISRASRTMATQQRNEALADLERQGRISTEVVSTPGRPATHVTVLS